MEYTLSNEDRILLAKLTAELKRMNDRAERDTDNPDLVLSVSQTARMIGRSRQTVNKMVREGRLHKVVRHGMVGILKSEITNPQGCGGTAPWESCYQHVVKD